MVYKKTVAILWEICYTCMRCGVWRSLVARTAGGREVAGSNPVAPIFLTNSRISEKSEIFFLTKNRARFPLIIAKR